MALTTKTIASHFVKRSKPKKSKVFNKYWEFAVKRQEVFLKRLINPNGPWTNDPIINGHRFTNIFRASDRVSQYLINLQYDQKNKIEDVFFKTILFKIFNKIETYSYLLSELGEISCCTFSLSKYDEVLTKRMAEKQPIYSAAYIMPSAGSAYGYRYKHTNHLALLAKMMKDKVYLKVTECKSLEELYLLLMSYPSLGTFLAFQYAIDLNYSNLTDFSEMDFVIAGPGAKNGILKCFDSLGDFSFEDVIKLVTENQEDDCEALGLQLPTLLGRKLQLVDCQNLFCEVDKYLRVSNPEITTGSGRIRIKQKFKTAKGDLPSPFFPPKWGINSNIEKVWEARVTADMFL